MSSRPLRTNEDYAVNSDLRAELLQMVEEDQATVVELTRELEADEAFREEFYRCCVKGPWSLVEWGSSPLPDSVERLLETNRRITARFREIVDEHGWPGRSLVGRLGADAAWLLLQHADTEQEFRRTCIELLQEAVPEGEADPRHLGLIADRVESVENGHQVFGTDIIVKDGKAQLQWPLVEPDRVDALRQEIGLPPLEQDMESKVKGHRLTPFGPLRTEAENQWPERPAKLNFGTDS